jgi:hypothetical protein
MFNGIGCYTDGSISYEGEWCNNKFNVNGLIITNNYNYNGSFLDRKKTCNHVVLCETCEASIRNTQKGRRCPVCRKPYTKYIKIFI